MACCGNYQEGVWLEWLHEGLAASNHHHHAKYRHLLVGHPHLVLVACIRELTQILFRSSYEMAKAYFKRTLREEAALNASKL